jgi:hypothetical protein
LQPLISVPTTGPYSTLKKGEAIRIDHKSGHVLICEAKRGYFPCTMGRLTENEPVQEPEALRKPKSNDKDQLNMFGL